MALASKQLVYMGIGVAIFGAMIMKASSPSGSTAMAAVEPTLSASAPADASQHRVTKRRGEPSIVSYDTGDVTMDKAIRDARQHLNHFWDHYDEPQRGEESFTLKVAVPVKSAETNEEHIWVMDVQPAGGGYSGALGNQPNWIEGKNEGDRITFTENMISDWGYRKHGKLIGFYTTRIMLDQATPEEAAKLRAAFGQNPD
jgi:uncharacterized protein YegJ (DUF2314 family)